MTKRGNMRRVIETEAYRFHKYLGKVGNALTDWDKCATYQRVDFISAESAEDSLCYMFLNALAIKNREEVIRNTFLST